MPQQDQAQEPQQAHLEDQATSSAGDPAQEQSRAEQGEGTQGTAPEEGQPQQEQESQPEQRAGGLEQDDLALDKEAEELLAELARSQMEVKRMLGAQNEQAQHLGGLKEQLATELHDLQDDNWKLETFGELEALKLQLSSLNGLEGRLNTSESLLDERDKQEPKEPKGDGVDDELKEDYNPEEIAELQAKLDADLADMFSQLQAVKSEASEVSTRKMQLEKELQELLQQQVADAEQPADQDGKPGMRANALTAAEGDDQNDVGAK